MEVKYHCSWLRHGGRAGSAKYC